MKIFVSHSLQDKELLDSIHDILAHHGMELLIAEHILEFDKTITEKIKNMINQCDVGLALLTRNGINSHFVSEELGYLEAKNKFIIRVIEKGYKDMYSGFKYGTDFILLDPVDPIPAYNSIVNAMVKHNDGLWISKRNAMVFAGVVVFLLALSQAEESVE